MTVLFRDSGEMGIQGQYPGRQIPLQQQAEGIAALTAPNNVSKGDG